PAYIHVGFRVGPAADAPLRLMTAAAGSLDLNHRSTIVDIPPAGLELTFFWDALQDLGADADLDAVTIRAGILRANGTDPREAVCDFQPVVAISFGSTLACTSEAPMLDGETLVQGAPGSPYSDQLEVSGGEPPLRFEVIDPTTGNPRLDSNIGFGLTLDPATGLVSGTIDPAAPPVITFIARVIDACSTEPTGQRAGSQVALIPGGRFDQALFTVPIEPITAQCDAPAPQLTTTALPNGEVGVPYEFQLEATGGVGTLSFSAEGLPAEDLSIDSNGRIAGTPTAPGTFTVVATVRDSCEFPQEDTETLTLTVDCGAAPSFGGAATLPDAFVGQSYDQSFPVEFPNGAGSLQITAGVLPEGLSLSTETARNTVLVRISGIPTSGEQAGQTFNFTLTATDTCPSGGLTTNRDLSITLRDIPACPEPAPDITTTTLPDGVAGEPYSATIDVTGGTLPVGPVTIIDNGGLDSLTIQPDGRTLAGNL
ncbi:MAG TPA: putative Ig domain-containing protein, partial [bacterium]|nr:putative Ig domain-containing protein [bacterium]